MEGATDGPRAGVPEQSCVCDPMPALPLAAIRLQNDHRYSSLAHVLGIRRQRKQALPPEFVVLLAVNHMGAYRHPSTSHFDDRVWVGDQIAIPGRVAGSAVVDSEYNVAVAIDHVDERNESGLTCLRTRRRQKEQRQVFVAGYSAVVLSELGDNPLVPNRVVNIFTHASTIGRNDHWVARTRRPTPGVHGIPDSAADWWQVHVAHAI